MFLANSLKEKLKRNFLENNPDSIGKAPFSYNPPPRDPRQLLSFKGEAKGLPPAPSQEFTTQKLQALDKQEWQNTFSLTRLHNEWKTRVELDFDDKHKKFSDDMILPEVKESKQYVKELIDRDVLDLKKKRWNVSSDCNDKSFRPELKKTLFEVSHGLKDFTVVPLKEKIVEEGCDSRDIRVIDGLKWDISTKLENDEKKYEDLIAKSLALENSARYWRENEYNRLNGEPYPISEDRKKVEIIRYFKKYRTPYQKSIDHMRTMQKVKNDTAIIRTEVEESVKYRNPGALKCPEKINAIVLKEMFNTYKYKYNELTGKLDKEEIKKRQREENKFRWKDEDLVKKMISVNTLDDTSWFKPLYAKERIANSQEKFKKELLKPLVIKGNDIFNEQEKIQEMLEDEYKRQQKRELMLKQKFSSKKSNEKYVISKYPMDKETYTTMTTMQTEGNEFTKKEDLPIIEQLAKKLNNDHFVDAYKKVASEDVEKKNKLYKKLKGNVEVIYSHPGTYREFDFEEKEVAKKKETIKEENVNEENRDNDNNKEGGDENNGIVNPINNNNKGSNKVKLWSCCMNSDEHSKGCHKEIVKKFKWLYDE